MPPTQATPVYRMKEKCCFVLELAITCYCFLFFKKKSRGAGKIVCVCVCVFSFSVKYQIQILFTIAPRSSALSTTSNIMSNFSFATLN